MGDRSTRPYAKVVLTGYPEPPRPLTQDEIDEGNRWEVDEEIEDGWFMTRPLTKDEQDQTLWVLPGASGAPRGAPEAWIMRVAYRDGFTLPPNWAPPGVDLGKLRQPWSVTPLPE